jgi:hypothetical protein
MTKRKPPAPPIIEQALEQHERWQASRDALLDEDG